MATLRFITCGSVDDGKSTLIGRLLYETKSIFEDQLENLVADSRQFGTQGESLDFALLVDGLQAEREQGITIDVAYRFFATPKRRFIVADTPGHEQYTRNMATGASTADLAIVLVDARKGILTQTLRHSRIVSLMGIKQVVLAINKMDLVDYSQHQFEKMVEEYQQATQDLSFESMEAIPICAVTGENIFVKQGEMSWYGGPSLIDYLEDFPLEQIQNNQPFRLPVQWVNRPNAGFRGFCGTIAQGTIELGDSIVISPSARSSQVKEIIFGFDQIEKASKGMAVTLTLEDEVDISRGDVLVGAHQPCETAQQFETELIWMSETAMISGQQFIMKLHSKEVQATVTKILYRHDIESGQQVQVDRLAMNEIARVQLSTNQPIVFEPYTTNKTMGAFILIHKHEFETVSAGMIQCAFQNHNNLHWQSLEVTQKARSELKVQSAKCIWMTGLSGSGKSTIGNMLEKQLHANGQHTYILDGDNLRYGLNSDLGFTDQDRTENIRRVAEVARLMVDAGLVVIVCLISPFRTDRGVARNLFDKGEFIEVFIDTTLEVCEQRDVKGLYAKARAGELKKFTGIDSPYEHPSCPEVHLETSNLLIEQCVQKIMENLNQ